MEAALREYESIRIPATAKVVLENRTAPPDLIIDTVERLSGGERFEQLSDIISEDELRQISANYQKVAGWDKDSVARAGKG